MQSALFRRRYELPATGLFVGPVPSSPIGPANAANGRGEPSSNSVRAGWPCHFGVCLGCVSHFFFRLICTLSFGFQNSSAGSPPPASFRHPPRPHPAARPRSRRRHCPPACRSRSASPRQASRPYGEPVVPSRRSQKGHRPPRRTLRAHPPSPCRRRDRPASFYPRRRRRLRIPDGGRRQQARWSPRLRPPRPCREARARCRCPLGSTVRGVGAYITLRRIHYSWYRPLRPAQHPPRHHRRHPQGHQHRPHQLPTPRRRPPRKAHPGT
jgi:hypothetical protein